MDTLVTVVTHNGGEKLKACLDSLSVKAGRGFDLCIVDNCTTCEESLQHISGYNVIRNEKTVYDTGGYIQSFIKNRDYDRYLFMQDDCIIREKNWLKKLEEALGENSVVALSTFTDIWDSEDQKVYAKNVLLETIGSPTIDEESTFIFGPIFYVAFSEARKMIADSSLGYHMPTNKMQQQAYERIWGLLAQKLGIRINSLAGNNQYIIDSQHYREGHIIEHSLTKRS